MFKSLVRKDLDLIVDFELRKVRERLEKMGLALSLDDEAKAFLIEKGYNPDFGARPLRRAIEQFVEDPISEEILRDSYKGQHKIGVTVRSEVDTDGEETKHLFFEAVAGERPAPAEAAEPDEPVEQPSEASDES